VFHVSVLRKYLKDTEEMMEAEPGTIKQDWIVEYIPTQILESSKCVMSKCTINYVKLL
jgi:hypothetical protein